MANEENLKKGAPYRFRAGEEQVEKARKAGRASGEARRRKKTMREAAKMLLDMQVPRQAKELKQKLAIMGVSEEDFTYQTAVLVGVINQAMKGNTKAAAFLRDTAGENPENEFRKEDQKLRREMFEYQKEKDAGVISEIEDMDEVEADIYGESDSD